MSEKLTVVVQVLAKKGCEDFVKFELNKIAEIAHTREGCMQFDLHQDNDNKCLFIAYENWKSAECLSKHVHLKKVQDYYKITRKYIDDLNVYKMSKLN